MRQAVERQFTSFDGTPIFYRHWPAATGQGGRAIVLFHRGHEHSGRLQHLVDELGLDDVAMFAWDARGHGRNGGERGYSPSIGASIKDADAFVRHIGAHHSYSVPANGRIVYPIRNSLYLNITNRCTASSTFCVRYHTDFVKGHSLRLKQEPTADEVITAIGNPKDYAEVVFCGYGEPSSGWTR